MPSTNNYGSTSSLHPLSYMSPSSSGWDGQPGSPLLLPPHQSYLTLSPIPVVPSFLTGDHKVFRTLASMFRVIV